MLQLVKNPNFDFMGKSRVLLTISAVLVLASVVLLLTRGINLGIEFTGGAEVQLKFAERPDVSAIRSALAGVSESTPVVTTIGGPAAHEVYIKIGLAGAADDLDTTDLTQQVVDALRTEEVRRLRDQKRVDLNVADEAALERVLVAGGVPRIDARALAEGILAERRERAIFASLEALAGMPGMTPQARRALEQGAFLGPFALRSQSYIGPAIGRELMQKAFWAIVGSLAGMLIYIWIRFQIHWGLAAVVALTHDTLLTLGLFSLVGKELSLPVVAAFLTLIGYSVNDTVVVFDRIRENIRMRGGRDLAVVVNRSINQTLSRTIITTGSTWAVVSGLFLFGGEALSAFSLVLTVGVLIGTYSSVFVASPIVVRWRGAAKRRSPGSQASSSGGAVKKVRRTTAVG